MLVRLDLRAYPRSSLTIHLTHNHRRLSTLVSQGRPLCLQSRLLRGRGNFMGANHMVLNTRSNPLGRLINRITIPRQISSHPWYINPNLSLPLFRLMELLCRNPMLLHRPCNMRTHRDLGSQLARVCSGSRSLQVVTCNTLRHKVSHRAPQECSPKPPGRCLSRHQRLSQPSLLGQVNTARQAS